MALVAPQTDPEGVKRRRPQQLSQLVRIHVLYLPQTQKPLASIRSECDYARNSLGHARKRRAGCPPSANRELAGRHASLTVPAWPARLLSTRVMRGWSVIIRGSSRSLLSFTP
jgi:hypothetical protein